MLPHDLSPKIVPLPAGDRRSAVLFSGGQTRHLRLGYLIQRHYPGVLKQWWITVAPASEPLAERLKAAGSRLASTRSATEALGKIRRGEFGEAAGLVRRRFRRTTVRKSITALRRQAMASSVTAERQQVEREMFGAEVDALRRTATLHPTPVEDGRIDEVALAIEQLAPYLVLSHGAAELLPTRFLTAARGLAIGLREGWTDVGPRGSATETALYHRQLLAVGHTVALIGSFESGALLRRCTATLHPDDSVAHCLMAAHAAGHRLLCDTLDDVLTRETIAVYPTGNNLATPPAPGASIRQDALSRDFSAGWLADALAAAQDF